MLAISLASGFYAASAAVMAAHVLEGPSDPLTDTRTAVSVLKPLYGAEPGLEETLATFLSQDYLADVQIVFGLHSESDPARETVEKLKRRFPDRDIALAIDEREHGANRKVSNLINMMSAARHDVLVLADSDIEVPPSYLKTVVAALLKPGVGVVTCPYAAFGFGGFWSRFAAMGVSYQFLPNALFAIASGISHPVFGSTIALRRATLQAIGGFEAFADLLADDYEIGRAVRALGLSIAYPPLTVIHHCAETGPGGLIAHELRWQRTIRTIDPAGHWGSILTHAFMLALVGAAFLGFSLTACMVLAAVLLSRLFLKARIDHIVGAEAGPAWLLPMRDMVSFGIFLVSLFGHAVRWRGDRLHVGRGGAMSKSQGA